MIANFLKNRFFAAAIVVVTLAATAAPDCSAQRLSSIETRLARRLALGEISGRELTRAQQRRIAPTAFAIATRADDAGLGAFNEALDAFLANSSPANFDAVTATIRNAGLQSNRRNFLIHQIIFEAPRPRRRQRSVRRLVERSFANQPSRFERLFGSRRFELTSFDEILIEVDEDGDFVDGGFTEDVLTLTRLTGFDASMIPAAVFELTRPRTPEEIATSVALGLEPDEVVPPFTRRTIAPAALFLELVLSTF